MKKILCVLSVVAVCCGMFPCSAPAQVADFFYNTNGEHITVPLSDSLVFIKHNELYPAIVGVPFITLAAILTDDYAPLASAGNAAVYQLNDTVLLADALVRLKEMPEVDVANPVIVYDEDSSSQYATDEIIVRFHDETNQAVIDSINDFYHVEVIATDEDFLTQFLLRITAGTGLDVLSLSQAYFESGLCRYAQPNFMSPARPQAIPDDSYYGDQWNLNNTGQAGGIAGADIDAERAWEITEGNDAVVVAVMDFGFELDHEDLVGTSFWWPYDGGP